MRKEQTEQEYKLWQLIRNAKLGVKFRRQFPIDNKYIADFICLEKRRPTPQFKDSTQQNVCQAKWLSLVKESIVFTGWQQVRFGSQETGQRIPFPICPFQWRTA